MKQVKSIEEALEAQKQGLLVGPHDEPWEVSSMQVNEVIGMIELNELYWKPQTVELAEVGILKDGEYVSIEYVVKGKYIAPPWQTTGRTATATLALHHQRREG